MSFLNTTEITFEDGRDYIVTDKMNIYEVLHEKNEQTIILTLFKNKYTELTKQFKGKSITTDQETNTTKSADIIINTPISFLKNYHKYNLRTRFIILNEPHLIDDLGYAAIIQELRSKHNFSFIAISTDLKKYNFLNNPLIISYNQNYFIKCTNNEIFYVLFSIFKYNLLTGSIGILVQNDAEKKKMKIFLKTLNKYATCEIICNSDGKQESEHKSFNNLLISAENDCVFQIKYDRAVYLGSKEPAIANLTSSKFDFDRIEKFKYRIDDFLKALSPSVLKGKKEFAYERFLSLRL